MPVLQYFLDETVRNNKPNSLGQNTKTDGLCRSSFQQVKQPLSARASCPESGKRHDTVALELQELRTSQTPLAPHLANTLGPDRSYHWQYKPAQPAMIVGCAGLYRQLYDRSGPRVFARCGARGVCEVRSSCSSSATVSCLLPLSGQEGLADRGCFTC